MPPGVVVITSRLIQAEREVVIRPDPLGRVDAACLQCREQLRSDYPFPLGEEIVGELIRTAEGFSDSARSKLLGGNAQKFLNITNT